mgnify:CR=1 FL=1
MHVLTPSCQNMIYCEKKSEMLGKISWHKNVFLKDVCSANKIFCYKQETCQMTILTVRNLHNLQNMKIICKVMQNKYSKIRKLCPKEEKEKKYVWYLWKLKKTDTFLFKLHTFFIVISCI